jgi:MoaA/NifB/PqqE/SkfB family radical SAM enzyme
MSSSITTQKKSPNTMIRELGVYLKWRSLLAFRDKPFVLTLAITTHCNLSCKMCMHHERYVKTGKQSHMDLSLFKNIIDEVKPNFVNLTPDAGEPFMHPKIFSMIKYSKERGVRVEIATNGTLLQRDYDKIIDSGLDILKISIDGSTDETYTKIRGENYLTEIKKGIILLNASKAKNKLNNLSIRFNFVILQDNYREISDMISLAHELNVKTISFMRPIIFESLEGNSTIGSETIFDEINDSVLFTEIEKGITLSKDLGIKTDLHKWVQNYDQYWVQYKKGLLPIEKCMRPWLAPFVDVNGGIWPCAEINVFGRKLGDRRIEDFHSILHSRKYWMEMKNFLLCTQDYKICKGCNCTIYYSYSRYFNIIKRKVKNKINGF